MARLSISIVFLVCFSQTHDIIVYCRISGPCANIGYSTKCCPPGGDCGTTNASGICSCGAGCHELYQDCCEDAFCRPKPRTCQDIGCCNNPSISVQGCETVTLYDEKGAKINQKIDCTISNCPQNCTQAKFSPGFCKWQFKSMRETCQVFRPGNNCYCDPYCICFNDCCDDIQEIEISDTYFAMGKPEQCMQMYTRFEKEVKQQGDSSNEDHSTIQIDDEVYVQFVYAIYARLREMWEDKDFP